MKQTPAAILVLSASMLGYTAAAHSYQTSSVALALAAAALATWGIVSLVVDCIRQREQLIDNHARLEVFDKLISDDPSPAVATSYRMKAWSGPATRIPDHVLSPDVRQQLSLVSRINGEDCDQIINDVLRRHLPRYGSSRSA